MPEKTSELRAALARVLTGNDEMRRGLQAMVKKHSLFLPAEVVQWCDRTLALSLETDALLGALVDAVENGKG